MRPTVLVLLFNLPAILAQQSKLPPDTLYCMPLSEEPRYSESSECARNCFDLESCTEPNSWNCHCKPGLVRIGPFLISCVHREICPKPEDAFILGRIPPRMKGKWPYIKEPTCGANEESKWTWPVACQENCNSDRNECSYQWTYTCRCLSGYVRKSANDPTCVRSSACPEKGS